MTTKTVYVSIGNSDDKLTQAEWADFYTEVDATLRGYSEAVHGAWTSASTSRWQNANWCIEIQPDKILKIRMPYDRRDVDTESLLRERLGQLAARYRQDSIAWAEATTEFIAPKEVSDGRA